LIYVKYINYHLICIYDMVNVYLDLFEIYFYTLVHSKTELHIINIKYFCTVQFRML